MKKLLPLIILFLAIDAKSGFAQRDDTTVWRKRFFFGVQYAYNRIVKSKNSAHEFTVNALYYFREEKFYTKLDIDTWFIERDQKTDIYVRTSGFGMSGGVCLFSTKNGGLYIDGGAGFLASASDDYRGGYLQGGIKYIEWDIGPEWGGLGLTFYHHTRKKEAINLVAVSGFCYWPFSKRRKK